ncbi:MAG: dolichol kinase [Bacteroidota bacterium]|nr:dolichol kinase [Bacteroidota bacterium]
MPQGSGTIAYSAELIRKAIHLSSLSIPIIYYFIPRELALKILVPLTLVFSAVDFLRYYHEPTAHVFYKFFGWMLRSHEQDHAVKRFNGATYVLISATMCVVIFPKLITITSFAILIIGDSTAALVGRRYGRRKFFRKSMEGSTAFFVSALVVGFLTPKIFYAPIEYVIAACGAAVGTVIEALSIHVDDNLSIPISISVVMWVLYNAFYPSSLSLLSHVAR